MVDSPSLVLAFAAGVVSFVSPCCLPLVPGYLATVCGGQPGEARPSRVNRQVLGRSVLFVATFSAIFVLLGLGATAIGAVLFANKPLLNQIAGGAIIVMGVVFVASVFVVRLNREFRPHALIERAVRRGHARVCLLQAPLRRHPGRLGRRADREIAMGYLVITGELFRLNIEVQQFLGKLGLNFFQSV